MKLTPQQRQALREIIDEGIDTEIEEPDYEVGAGGGAYGWITDDGMDEVARYLEELK